MADLAMKKEEAVRRLGVWGYLSANEMARLLIDKRGDDALHRAVVEFKARWGCKYCLSPDDHLCDATKELMERRFCHCPDNLEELGEGLRRWNTHTLGWGGRVTVGNLSFLTAQQFTRGEVADACNMDLVIRNSRRNIVADEGAIDGPGGTLARAFLPAFPSSSNEVRTQEYDTAEFRLSQHAFNIVVLHETGHSLGLPHDSTPAVAVMDPFLNESLTGFLPPDIRALQDRYGPPAQGGGGGQPDPGDDPIDRLCPEAMGIARLVMRSAERGAERALERRP